MSADTSGQQNFDDLFYEERQKRQSARDEALSAGQQHLL